MAFVYCGDLRWGEEADARPRGPGPAPSRAPPPACCPSPQPHCPRPSPLSRAYCPSPGPSEHPPQPCPQSQLSHCFLQAPLPAVLAALRPRCPSAGHADPPQTLPAGLATPLPGLSGHPPGPTAPLRAPLPSPPPRSTAPKPPGRVRRVAVDLRSWPVARPAGCEGTERGPGGSRAGPGFPATPPRSRALERTAAGPHRDRCLRRSRFRSCGPAGTCSRPSAPWRRCS
jgi:hypothetical protein